MKSMCTLLLTCVALIAAPLSSQSKSPATQVDRALVTFIELGSIHCIPCRMMQPVMEAIEEKYGSQVKVVFYDVWTREQQHYAQEYAIRLIPTQVFLDETGKEFFRHEGFFPEAEIHKLFQKRGLKIQNAGDK